MNATEILSNAGNIIAVIGGILAVRKYSREMWRKMSEKKVDRLIARKELIDQLRQSPIELAAYIGEQASYFAFLFVCTCFLTLQALLMGALTTSASEMEETLFRTIVGIELLGAFTLLLYWPIQAMKNFQAVRSASEYEKLNKVVEEAKSSVKYKSNPSLTH